MKQKTRDTLDILNKVTGDDPELRQMIKEETLHTKISRLIYDARQHAGLTQQGLAELVGTTQSVVVKVFKYYLPVPIFLFYFSFFTLFFSIWRRMDKSARRFYVSAAPIRRTVLTNVATEDRIILAYA